MKQLFRFNFFTVFFSIFACILLHSTTLAAVSQHTEDQLSNKINRTEKAPVLIELFTAEGCPMCPPADKNLMYLDREQPFPETDIITLSLHVDYWNGRGWKDEFSSAIFTRRQDIYAQIFRVEQIFTPQMVVDGRMQFAGADLAKAQKAIVESAKITKGKVELLTAKTASGDIKIQAKLAELPPHETATVFLAIAENNLTSKRGKSASSRREYVSVVRELKSLGLLISAQNKLETEIVLPFQTAWKFVVFAQENASRKILAVNQIKLS